MGSSCSQLLSEASVLVPWVAERCVTRCLSWTGAGERKALSPGEVEGGMEGYRASFGPGAHSVHQ